MEPSGFSPFVSFAVSALYCPVSGFRVRLRLLEWKPHPSAHKIGYGQAKRLAPEPPGLGTVEGLRGGVCVDRMGKRSRCAHLVPTLALCRGRLIPLEARHPRDDDLVSIGLEHAVAQAASNRHTRDAGEKGKAWVMCQHMPQG